MIMLVTGASGSGKSEYAEGAALELAKAGGLPLYYVATMRPVGEEAKKRVVRHRRLRAGKGFRTIEQFTNLIDLELGKKGVVLLECMSNLTANEMFEDDGAHDDTLAAVLNGISLLTAECEHLVIVTNDIFSDGVTYDEMTTLYQQRLGIINRMLAAMSQVVVEVVCGIPLTIKDWKSYEKGVEQL